MATRKATGVEACALACRFLLAETATRLVVDPFCGQGTVLAVANALGLDAVGVDHSQRCCRAARKLRLPVEGLQR
jgi:DNA modification methylase